MKISRSLVATLVAFVAVLAWQALLPPITGYANNGDFGKVTGIFGLRGNVEDEYRYVSRTLVFDPAHAYWFEQVSSEQLLAAFAVGANRLISKTGALDITLMGAIHGAVLTAAFYLALPLFQACSRTAGLSLAALCVVVFADSAYALYLNTFYMDAAAIAFLLLSAVLYVRWTLWGRTSCGLALIAAAVLFASAKPQHLWAATALAVLLLFSRGDRRLRMGGALAVAAAACLVSLSAPRTYSATVVYNVVFFEILPKSPAARQDMAELGLDAQYERNIGTHAFDPRSGMNDAEFVRRFAARASPVRVGLFFARHPRRAWSLLHRALGDAGRQRSPMGNFDRSAGMPPFAESRAFSLWSGLKRSLFEGHGAPYLWYFVGASFVLCATLAMNRSVFLKAGLALFAMGAVSMLVAGLGDVLEATRHFSLFNALADVMFVGAAAAVTRHRPWAGHREHRAPARAPSHGRRHDSGKPSSQASGTLSNAHSSKRGVGASPSTRRSP